MYELLKGARIIDLTTTYLGPYATQWLGDMGADVIKVEALTGDVGRSPLPSRSPDMGAGFINSNRNKRVSRARKTYRKCASRQADRTAARA